MKTDLEIQLENSTPPNLLEVDSIKTLMNLYTDSFDELQGILEEPLNILDTDFLINKFEETGNEKFNEIRRELFSIHLQEIFTTFDEIEDSEEIYDKFKKIYESLGLSTENLKIVADIDKSINSEYINSSTLYKTKKGTRAGFFFVYDIINKAGIQAINADGLFRLIEGTEEFPNTPYEYTVQTSLYREVFERTIIPLAHPVGFNWNFVRLLYVSFVDYFGLEEHATMSSTTLTCYGFKNTSLTQIEIIDSEVFGKLYNFEVTKDQHENEKIVIDYEPLDGTEGKGLRLIRDYNGEVILFDRQSVKVLHNTDNNEYVGQIQYLEIADIKLENDTQGILEIEMVPRVLLDEEFDAIGSVIFNEYTIIDRPSVTFLFKLKDDRENVWYRSTMPLEQKIVDVDNIKYFLPINFTRQDILDGCNDYNGRIEKNYGTNCRIDYKIKYTYVLITTDIDSYVRNKRPVSELLAYNTNDIKLTPEERDEALSNGLDPFCKYYSSLDHTVEETKYWSTFDYWARLDLRSLATSNYIGQSNLDPTTNIGHIEPEQIVDPNTGEITFIQDGSITDLVIGGPWNISAPVDDILSIFDIGWNSNSTPERWEQHYAPAASADLALLVEPNTVQRYIKDNAEYVGGTCVNNNAYTAWEDFNMDEYIDMFIDQDYCTIDFSKERFIGDEEYIEYCSIISLSTIQSKVDAEVYRAQWNFSESSIVDNKYDYLGFGLSTVLEDNADIPEEELDSEDYKIFNDKFYETDQDTNIGNFFINGLNALGHDDMYIGYQLHPTETKAEVYEIQMFKNEPYCYNAFSREWDIDDNSNITECSYIGSITNATTRVDADVYRAEWNFLNKDEYEDYKDESHKNITDIFVESNDEELIELNILTNDEYEKGYDEQLIGDFFDIGETDNIIQIGSIKPVIEGDWSFGVYRFNEANSIWEIVEDNNVNAA